MKRAATMLALATLLTGCPTSDPAKAVASAAADSGDASQQAGNQPDPKLPVPADFEQAAVSEIDESNYAAELDAIAAELDAAGDAADAADAGDAADAADAADASDATDGG